MRKKYLAGFIVGAMFLPCLALAHQPRLISPGKDIVQISNPEISQAFYGELGGDSKYFEINSDKEFTLYLGLLEPKIDGAGKNLMGEIFYGRRGEDLIIFLDGQNHEWKEFHESFGGDDYWQGPEIEQKVQPGRYLIRVFTVSNQGKYVLAVGREESFPFGEAVNALKVLPAIKYNFFGKGFLSLFSGYVGLGILIVLLMILGAIIFVAIRICKKYCKR